MLLFDRLVSVVIADRGQIVGQDVPLRVDFSITKTNDEKQNTAEISVYNLSEKSRLAIDQNGLNVSLSVGYKQGAGLELLYSGQINRVLQNYAPPDILTNVQCGDGFEVIKNRFVRESFAPGTTVNEVLAFLQAQSNIPLKYNNVNSGDQYPNGIVVYGPWHKQITQVLNRVGARWSIQDGELVVLTDNTIIPDDIVYLNPTNGMLKTPQLITIDAAKVDNPDEEGKAGIRVECLLNPRIRPSMVIDVTAKFYSGRYKVVRVDHNGSNFTNDWVSIVDAEVISA